MARPDEKVKVDLSRSNEGGDANGKNPDYPEIKANPNNVSPGDVIRQPSSNERVEFLVILEDGSPVMCKYYTDALILSRLVLLNLRLSLQN